MIEFNITEDTYNKCKKFAADSVTTSTDKYARRNQFNSSKIKSDIANGKIGEQQTYLHFVDRFPDLSEPDYQIYSSKNKNWDPDLKATNFKLAVKSQDINSATNWGKSWVFQYGNGGSYDCDIGVFGSVDNDDTHYVSFVSLNVPMRRGKIEAVVSIKWLKDKKLFKEMKKASLRGNKVAVYFNDLKKYNNLWQL